MIKVSIRKVDEEEVNEMVFDFLQQVGAPKAGIEAAQMAVSDRLWGILNDDPFACREDTAWWYISTPRGVYCLDVRLLCGCCESGEDESHRLIHLLSLMPLHIAESILKHVVEAYSHMQLYTQKLHSGQIPCVDPNLIPAEAYNSLRRLKKID